MSSKPPLGFLKKDPSFFLKAFQYLRSLPRPPLIQIGFGFFLLGLFLVLLQKNSLSRLDNYLIDTYFKIRPPLSEIDPRIVIVEITEDSTQLMGQFPWPRKYHAALTHILKKWQTSAVFFDIMFALPGSKPAEDTELANAFKEHGGVYLPIYQDSLNPPSGWHHGYPEIEQSAKGIGHIHTHPERDGIMRRVSGSLSDPTSAQPHIALKMVADLLNKKDAAVSLIPPGALLKEGTFFINWAGKWADTFSHFSYADIFRSYHAIQQNKKPAISPESFRDKIVLVAFTGTTGSDVKTTPLEPAYPGVGIIANVLNTILTQQWIHTAPLRINAFLLFILASVGIAACVPFRPVWSTIIVFLCLISWTIFCYVLFVSKNFLLNGSYGLAYLLTFYLFSAVWSKALSDRERVELLELATRDGLTGLYLRRYFLVVFQRIINRPPDLQKPNCVIMLDVDHFKKINDEHGHETGDIVLKGLAHILKSHTRTRRVEIQSDCVARYGGEEFIILLVGADIKNAAFNVAERIRKAVETYSFKYDTGSLKVTISMGIAEFRHGENMDDCIRRADQALYRAKTNGRNQICLETL